MPESQDVLAQIHQLFGQYPTMRLDSIAYDGFAYGVIFTRLFQYDDDPATIMPKCSLLLTIEEVKNGKLELLLEILGGVNV